MIDNFKKTGKKGLSKKSHLKKIPDRKAFRGFLLFVR